MMAGKGIITVKLAGAGLIFMGSLAMAQDVTQVNVHVADKNQIPVENVLARIHEDGVVRDSTWTDENGNGILMLSTVGTDDEPDTPLSFSLSQNYPNPWNPATTIKFSTLSKGTFVIRNLLGQEVARSKIPGAGRYTAKWGGANDYGLKTGSGIYFYSVITGEGVKTKKMILLDGGSGEKLNITGSNIQSSGFAASKKALDNWYLLSFEKDNMTGLSFPVAVNGDTAVNAEVNIGPTIIDTIPKQLLSVGDTMIINMDEFVYNDEQGLYLPRNESFNVDGSFISYAAAQPETISTWVDAVDSEDNSLRDSLLLRVQVPYVATSLFFDLPGLIEISEDSDIDTLLADLNDYVLPSQSAVFNLASQSNPGLANLSLNGYSILVDSLRRDGYGESVFVVGASNGDTAAVDSVLLRVLGVNDAPDLSLSSVLASVTEDTSGPLAVAAYSAFDPDLGDLLSFQVSSAPPGKAFFSLDGGNVFLDSLALNFFGPVVYTLSVSDSAGLADSSSASLQVAPVNDAPDLSFEVLVSSVGEDTTGFPITLVSYTVDDVDNDSVLAIYLNNDYIHYGMEHSSTVLGVPFSAEITLDSLPLNFNGVMNYAMWILDTTGGSYDSLGLELVVEPRPEPIVDVTFLFKAAYPDTFLTSGTNVLTWREMLPDTSGYVGDLDSVVLAGYSVTLPFVSGTWYDINGKNSGSADGAMQNRAYTFIRRGPDVLEQRSYLDLRSPVRFMHDDTVSIHKVMDVTQVYGVLTWLDHGFGTRRLPNGVVNVWWNTSGDYIDPTPNNLAWTQEALDTIMTWPYMQGVEFQITVGGPFPSSYPIIEMNIDPTINNPSNGTSANADGEIFYVELQFQPGVSRTSLKGEIWEGTTDSYEIGGVSAPAVSGGEFTEIGRLLYSLNYIGKPKTRW